MFRSDRTFLYIEIKDGEILFRGDMTEENQFDRELAYHMDSDNSHRLLVQLRLRNGTRNKLSTIFKKEFGDENGAMRFIEFCKEHFIEFQVLSV